jgi:periplasmic copper chaperone A
MSIFRTAALAATLAFATLSAAMAHGYTLGDLVIGHPWTRATAPAAKVAGGYLTVENKGAQPDRLLSASFAGSSTVEVHEMSMDGGVMRMRELPKGLEIKPGAKIELKPGGYHLMFMGLTDGLKQGESLKGVLVFERAGRIEVEFKVEAIGARGEHDHSGHAPKTN